MTGPERGSLRPQARPSQEADTAPSSAIAQPVRPFSIPE
jgi:hypothetical protein